MNDRPVARQALPKANSPSVRRERARAAGKPVEPVWLRLSGSCIPCAYGEHDGCRHHPDVGDRGQFSKARPGAPCECEEHGHPIADTCRVALSGSWTVQCCAKPAKGFGEVPRSFAGVRLAYGSQRATYEQPMCGLHLAAIARRQANDARRTAEWEARHAADDRAAQVRRSAAEWAERLRAEFGVEAEGHDGWTGEALLVDVNPERLYALLSTVSDNLRDAGLTWAEVAGTDP